MPAWLLPAWPLPAWTVTLTYLGYALLVLLCAVAWLAALFDHVVYGRVEMGLLAERWRDIAWAVGRQAKPALTLAAACGGLAFLLALPGLLSAPENAPAAPSHRLYQVKAAAILLCLLLLVWLARGRMGEWDAEVAAAVVFAWALWVVAAGWLAHSGGAAVAGPWGWWLALGAAALFLLAVVVVAFLIWREGGIRMF